MIATKKNTIQLELKIRLTELEELDGIDTINKNLTEMIQQRATGIAKQTKTQNMPRIS